MDTKLKPTYRETTFWVMLLVSVPGLLAVAAGVTDALGEGRALDVATMQAALLALPIVAYLLARQYPRAKSVEAMGIHLAAAETVASDDDLARLAAVDETESPLSAGALERVDAEGEL